MNMSLFGVLALVLVFGTVSEGNHTLALSKSTIAEKLLVSQAFQTMENAIIMSSTDGEGLALRKAIETIRNEALACQAAGVPASTVKTVLDGILTALRMIMASAQREYAALNGAAKLIGDPIAAANAIKEGFSMDADMVYVIGVPILDAQGAALALVGGDAKEGLKKSVVLIETAGDIALENMQSIAEVSTFGVKAGGPAAVEGLKAAKEFVYAGALAILSYLIQSSKYAMDALRLAAPKALTKQDSLVPGILDSLKTKVSTKDPGALSAIARLDSKMQSALKVMQKQNSIDAANISHQGLVSTILDTADAMSVAQDALDMAGKLVDQDSEAAIAAVRKGMKTGQDEIMNGSANGLLGLGAAGFIAGEKAAEGLVPAVIEIEYGRAAAFSELALAEKMVVIGLRAGGPAAAQAISAAKQICKAAGNALYTQFADGGEIAFEVILSV